MLSPSAFALLADPTLFTATQCQRSLALFNHYDFSVPRAACPEAIDKLFDWSEGTCLGTLMQLERRGILVTITRGKVSREPVSLWMIAEGMAWTPARLSSWWQERVKAKEREEFARASTSVGSR